MSETRYTIRAVARKTGLSPHVIRVWEKRYGAVKPSRTETNRRFYSDAEAERLGLLKRATSAGHSIGSIANLPNEGLARLAAEAVPVAKGDSPLTTPGAESFIKAGLAAVRELNTMAFEGVLSNAIVALGQHGLLERVIGPMARRLGELWRDGSITAGHEHFASAVIRSFLTRNSRPFSWNQEMPTIVIGTPAGQLHELGAVMASAAANDLGWRVVYLGTSLPAADIAGAALQNNARAVALSLVYPEDDPGMPGELKNLRKYLGEQVTLIAGGRAAEAYRVALEEVGAVCAKDIGDLYAVLESLRKPAPLP